MPNSTPFGWRRPRSQVALGRFKERVEQGLSESRCDYVPIDTSESPAVALSRYLVARRRRAVERLLRARMGA